MILPSLSQWSQEHIQRVFESKTEEESIQALEQTFSKSLKAEINGRALEFEDIKRSVLAMRKESRESGLKVVWDTVIEVPADEMNKSGSFGGTYVIHGIRRKVSNSEDFVDLARHKVVTVRIESLSEDSSETIDTRKVVDLVMVALDRAASKG